MINSHKIMIYGFFAFLLQGCNEDFNVGVSKGGSGNGKPSNEFENVEFGAPVNQNYKLWLSQPVSDVCNGVKRTLQFIHPISHELIEENQTIDLTKKIPFESQIKAQVVWKNISNQPKTIIRSCDEVLFVDEERNSTSSTNLVPNLTLNDTRCDVTSSPINPGQTIINTGFEYTFVNTLAGALVHHPRVEFTPQDTDLMGCKALDIPFYIYNKP